MIPDSCGVSRHEGHPAPAFGAARRRGRDAGPPPGPGPRRRHGHRRGERPGATRPDRDRGGRADRRGRPETGAPGAARRAGRRRGRQVPDPGTLGHARPHRLRRLVPGRAGHRASPLRGQRCDGRARHGRRPRRSRRVAPGDRAGIPGRPEDGDQRAHAGRPETALPQLGGDRHARGRPPGGEGPEGARRRLHQAAIAHPPRRHLRHRRRGEEAGLPFAGHVPDASARRGMSDPGQKSFEHLIGIFEGSSAREDELPEGRQEPRPVPGGVRRGAARGPRRAAGQEPHLAVPDPRLGARREPDRRARPGARPAREVRAGQLEERHLEALPGSGDRGVQCGRPPRRGSGSWRRSWRSWPRSIARACRSWPAPTPWPASTSSRASACTTSWGSSCRPASRRSRRYGAPRYRRRSTCRCRTASDASRRGSSPTSCSSTRTRSRTSATRGRSARWSRPGVTSRAKTWTRCSEGVEEPSRRPLSLARLPPPNGTY